ncbi:hypothetical protein G1K75_12495 [Tenacibaculum finnmarkense]|uniref:hypothetical protein n=1 Tax=Tenacibaculum finnmarkense TaxID=2781243 RepID=UPI001EFB1D89|nr:hypothetical protein [Tenacibaculum finnmarkense]MCG8806470.1 hypothetical protein [Tenacibaculum finnmarkense]MCG8857598.1 hypothetical protein [Tenacibaculum finnmarkense]
MKISNQIKEEITLIRNEEKYIIKANSTTTTIEDTLSFPRIVNLKVNQFQNAENEFFNDKILRLIIQTDKKANFDTIQTTAFKIGDSTFFGSLLELNFDGKSYHLFKYSNDDTNESFIIIDSLEKNTLDEFKKNSDSILLTLGFITGNLYQNEYYYQVLEIDNNLSITKATYYNKKEKSILSNVGLFAPFDFHQYLKKMGEEIDINSDKLYLKTSVFSNICLLINKNITLERSIKLILQGNDTTFLLLRASIYSIALETITGFIYEENKTKLKPIPDKTLSKKIIKKLKEELNEYESFLSDYGNGVLNSKIENLNTPTNSKKLSAPFDIYNIKLSKDELAILNHRNKFLHGTSPFEESELKDKDKEIAYITKKLLTLINSLILKYCDYKGHLVDYGGYHQLIHEKKLTEHLFKML